MEETKKAALVLQENSVQKLSPWRRTAQMSKGKNAKDTFLMERSEAPNICGELATPGIFLRI